MAKGREHFLYSFPCQLNETVKAREGSTSPSGVVCPPYFVSQPFGGGEVMESGCEERYVRIPLASSVEDRQALRSKVLYSLVGLLFRHGFDELPVDGGVRKVMLFPKPAPLVAFRRQLFSAVSKESDLFSHFVGSDVFRQAEQQLVSRLHGMLEGEKKEPLLELIYFFEQLFRGCLNESLQQLYDKKGLDLLKNGLGKVSSTGKRKKVDFFAQTFSDYNEFLSALESFLGGLGKLPQWSGLDYLPLIQQLKSGSLDVKVIAQNPAWKHLVCVEALLSHWRVLLGPNAASLSSEMVQSFLNSKSFKTAFKVSGVEQADLWTGMARLEYWLMQYGFESSTPSSLLDYVDFILDVGGGATLHRKAPTRGCDQAVASRLNTDEKVRGVPLSREVKTLFWSAPVEKRGDDGQWKRDTLYCCYHFFAGRVIEDSEQTVRVGESGELVRRVAKEKVQLELFGGKDSVSGQVVSGVLGDTVRLADGAQLEFAMEHPWHDAVGHGRYNAVSLSDAFVKHRKCSEQPRVVVQLVDNALLKRSGGLAYTNAGKNSWGVEFMDVSHIFVGLLRGKCCKPFTYRVDGAWLCGEKEQREVFASADFDFTTFSALSSSSPLFGRRSSGVVDPNGSLFHFCSPSSFLERF